MIFPVNRSPVTVNNRSGLAPDSKGQVVAVNIVLSEGQYWVPSGDILDLFFGGWGAGEEVDEEIAVAQKYNPFADPGFKKQAELLLGGDSYMKCEDRMAA